MFVLPCGAGAARSLKARRRAGDPLAVRHVLCADISPDPTDGIGRWGEADFVNAVTKASRRRNALLSGLSLYVLCACENRGCSRSLRLLKTLPAVSGKVRDHDLPFPFNIRRNVGIWKLLFMDDMPFVLDAAHSVQWNRGAYLVNGLGHCVECHSPRNFLGGIVAAQRFAGGPDPEGEGFVPNITRKGLSDWSERTSPISWKPADAGWRQRRRLDGTRDPELSKLSPEDRDAIANYLKSLPPVDGPPRPKKKDTTS